MKKELLQMFAVESNTIVSTDIEPAISVDFTSRISTNIKELQTVLGVSEMVPLAAGTDIKIYEMKVKNTPAQVAEGETIPLTKIERKLARTITLDLNKYRKNTTAEAIQKSGREIAVNQTDEKLVSEVQKDIKKTFYTALGKGTGTAEGANLQAVLANLWAKLQTRFEDMDITPIYFIHPNDVASYLATAPISMQTSFGFTYVENFMGLGTAIITPQATEKTVIATAKENLNGAYAPVSGDVGETFALTSDETGLIGMTHQPQSGNATIDTLMMSNVAFYPEFADGVFKGTIKAVAETK